MVHVITILYYNQKQSSKTTILRFISQFLDLQYTNHLESNHSLDEVLMIVTETYVLQE